MSNLDKTRAITIHDTNQSFSIVEIDSTDGFRALKAEWDALLRSSQANRLFLSWQWQFGWWETWSQDPGMRLLLLKACRQDRLVGIAPLYLDTVRLRGGMNVTRMQFIGNAWRKKATVRTEYLGFILADDEPAQIAAAFLEYVSAQHDWDEFVICDSVRDTDTYRQVRRSAADNKWLVSEAEVDRGVKIDTSGDFETYLQSLGRNTRLKLYNRRKHLYAVGNVELTHASANEAGTYFEILNAFHRRRWGRDCFAGPALSFHTNLVRRLGPAQSHDFSCLTIDGNPVSVSYNLQVEDTVYNIQSGFEENYDSKLSLGTLHMGFAIEAAFDSGTIQTFDLLAGGGKSEFYKKKYKGQAVEFVTLQITRNRLLRSFRAVYESLPVYMKRLISKSVSVLGL